MLFESYRRMIYAGCSAGEGEAYCKLEEPAVEVRAILIPQSEWPIPNESIALLTAIRKSIADKIEADRAKAGIQQILQNNVLCILGAHRTYRQLQHEALCSYSHTLDNRAQQAYL